MTLLVALRQAADAAAWPSGGGLSLARGFVALATVLGLLAVLVWVLRRGGLGRLGTRRRTAAIAVETAVPLGDRRSLVVVAVEGRRLLLGLTPAHVTLVAELQAAAPFTQALDRAARDGSPS